MPRNYKQISADLKMGGSEILPSISSSLCLQIVLSTQMAMKAKAQMKKQMNIRFQRWKHEIMVVPHTPIIRPISYGM